MNHQEEYRFCKKEITNSITAVTIKELIECTLKGDIRLPPIQRSAVWTNAQMINFWDSLLRGYPAGMMFINKSNEKSRNIVDNETKTNKNEGYDLFDGQQRVNAILLAHDKGFASKTRRLWIDFSREPSESSGLKFQLRMSSVGQPFGYDLNNPNQKAELSLRSKKWAEWEESHAEENNVRDAFNEIVFGEGLIHSSCDVIQFVDAINQSEEKINQLSVDARKRYEEFEAKLKKALSSNVVFFDISGYDEIVNNPEEYVRFFDRLGRGGTALSERELSYSIIKQSFPEVHDNIKKIMDSGNGLRGMIGELELVLGSARVAKFFTALTTGNKNEGAGPISPKQVSELAEQESEIRRHFLCQLPVNKYESGILYKATHEIKKSIVLTDTDPFGFPSILLAEIPSSLFDVLLLLLSINHSSCEFSCESDDVIKAFCLFWLVFINNESKASSIVYESMLEKSKESDSIIVDENFLREITGLLIDREVARKVPDKNDILNTVIWLKKDLPDDCDYCLRSWNERFKVSVEDKELDYEKMETLRVVTTNRSIIKRILMWTQRVYINSKFKNYDPTSDRDEDLPMDLDHLIPQSKFGFNWGDRYKRLVKLDPNNSQQEKNIQNKFRYQRNDIGNSLGNFRWLASSDNRSRQDGAIEKSAMDRKDDLYFNVATGMDTKFAIDVFNSIIEEEQWTPEDVKDMQRVIDLRSVFIFEQVASFVRKNLFEKE